VTALPRHAKQNFLPLRTQPHRGCHAAVLKRKPYAV
jgi:hypothetical protein